MRIIIIVRRDVFLFKDDDCCGEVKRRVKNLVNGGGVFFLVRVESRWFFLFNRELVIVMDCMFVLF